MTNLTEIKQQTNKAEMESESVMLIAIWSAILVEVRKISQKLNAQIDEGCSDDAPHAMEQDQTMNADDETEDSHCVSNSQIEQVTAENASADDSVKANENLSASETKQLLLNEVADLEENCLDEKAVADITTENESKSNDESSISPVEETEDKQTPTDDSNDSEQNHSETETIETILAEESMKTGLENAQIDNTINCESNRFETPLKEVVLEDIITEEQTTTGTVAEKEFESTQDNLMTVKVEHETEPSDDSDKLKQSQTEEKMTSEVVSKMEIESSNVETEETITDQAGLHHSIQQEQNQSETETSQTQLEEVVVPETNQAEDKIITEIISESEPEAINESNKLAIEMTEESNSTADQSDVSATNKEEGTVSEEKDQTEETSNFEATTENEPESADDTKTELIEETQAESTSGDHPVEPEQSQSVTETNQVELQEEAVQGDDQVASASAAAGITEIESGSTVEENISTITEAEVDKVMVGNSIELEHAQSETEPSQVVLEEIAITEEICTEEKIEPEANPNEESENLAISEPETENVPAVTSVEMEQSQSAVESNETELREEAVTEETCVEEKIEIEVVSNKESENLAIAEPEIEKAPADSSVEQEQSQSVVESNETVLKEEAVPEETCTEEKIEPEVVSNEESENLAISEPEIEKTPADSSVEQEQCQSTVETNNSELNEEAVTEETSREEKIEPEANLNEESENLAISEPETENVPAVTSVEMEQSQSAVESNETELREEAVTEETCVEEKKEPEVASNEESDSLVVLEPETEKAPVDSSTELGQSQSSVESIESELKEEAITEESSTEEKIELEAVSNEESENLAISEPEIGKTPADSSVEQEQCQSTVETNNSEFKEEAVSEETCVEEKIEPDVASNEQSDSLAILEPETVEAPVDSSTELGYSQSSVEPIESELKEEAITEESSTEEKIEPEVVSTKESDNLKISEPEIEEAPADSSIELEQIQSAIESNKTELKEGAVPEETRTEEKIELEAVFKEESNNLAISEPEIENLPAVTSVEPEQSQSAVESNESEMREEAVSEEARTEEKIELEVVSNEESENSSISEPEIEKAIADPFIELMEIGLTHKAEETISEETNQTEEATALEATSEKNPETTDVTKTALVEETQAESTSGDHSVEPEPTQLQTENETNETELKQESFSEDNQIKENTASEKTVDSDSKTIEEANNLAVPELEIAAVDQNMESEQIQPENETSQVELEEATITAEIHTEEKIELEVVSVQEPIPEDGCAIDTSVTVDLSDKVSESTKEDISMMAEAEMDNAPINHSVEPEEIQLETKTSQEELKEEAITEETHTEEKIEPEVISTHETNTSTISETEAENAPADLPIEPEQSQSVIEINQVEQQEEDVRVDNAPTNIPVQPEEIQLATETSREELEEAIVPEDDHSADTTAVVDVTDIVPENTSTEVEADNAPINHPTELQECQSETESNELLPEESSCSNKGDISENDAHHVVADDQSDASHEVTSLIEQGDQNLFGTYSNILLNENDFAAEHAMLSKEEIPPPQETEDAESTTMIMMDENVCFTSEMNIDTECADDLEERGLIETGRNISITSRT